MNENIYDSDSVFERVNSLFEWLPLAALIEDKILCVHGGIGSIFKKIEQIEQIERPLQIVHNVQTDIE